MLSLLGFIAVAAAVPVEQQQPLAPIRQTQTQLEDAQFTDASQTQYLTGRFLHITGEFAASQQV